MGENEVGQIGRGWHDAEPPGFRWTTRKAEFLLKNRGTGKITLDASCHHPDIIQAPVKLTLHINERHAGTIQFADHEWHELNFPLDTDAPVLSCELTVSRTWVPRETDVSTDERQLGVRVSRIRLE